MKAIVCDKCGKVVLLEDEKPYMCNPIGVYTLYKGGSDEVIELCEECGNDLISEVRKTREG